MNYRTVTILASEALGASGTKIIPLNIKDPITALIFNYTYTVGAGVRLLPEPDAFTKIELVDGSDVLMSLSGTEMAAMHFYDGHPFINLGASNIQSTSGHGMLRHYFGRFFRDPVLAFDPTKFRNPQLKISWDVTDIEANATDLTVTVLAECFDEKLISPVGFLQSREFHSYSPGASEHEYVDLPTDLLLRKLFLQTKEFGTSSSGLLTSLKLSEDNDKRIPFDILRANLENKCGIEFGICHQNTYCQPLGVADPIFCAPAAWIMLGLLDTTATRAIQFHGVTGGRITLVGDTSTDVLTGSISGILPYYVYCIPFGEGGDIEDWYDVTKVGSLRLDIESGADAAGAIFNTILQQLRRY